MNEKTVNINNFIGVYDNYITKEECNKAIKLFEEHNKFNNTLNRLDGEGAPVTHKQDQQFFARPNEIEIWWKQLDTLIMNFDLALKHYIDNVGIRQSYQNFLYTGLKIQKTLPTEGYHVWHIEHGADYDNASRILVFSVYLNDVEEGGETEFLNFSKRVKPKTGRIVIWPASFPYLHRGNPPISGEKYLLTSWIMSR